MKADTITKDYLSDSSIFADVFNYYIYKGEQVISPEELTERDPTELALPYGADGAVVPIQRFRDVQKLCTAMTDGKTGYVLYGVENQTDVHYAMAVKNNLYDALDYARQVEEAARSHRNARKKGLEEGSQEEVSELKKPNAGEFLGGFWKEDKLIPSVTVTLYFGSDEWDGPLNLFDMMGETDPRILSCLDDYHVRLIAPAMMSDEEIMRFKTSLREVLFFIKYSKDKEKLQEILISNEVRFREVERRAVDVITAITNSGLKYSEKEVKVDVCQALKEMREESQREGERIGEKRGEKRGEERGEERGKKIGALKTAQENARNFYRLGVEIEKVAEGVGYDIDTVKQWLNL